MQIIAVYPNGLYVVENCRNCLDEPILITGPEPLLTEFGSHYRLGGYEVWCNWTGLLMSLTCPMASVKRDYVLGYK